VLPPSIEYSIRVRGAPPSSENVAATATVVSPGVRASAGCGGAAAGAEDRGLLHSEDD